MFGNIIELFGLICIINLSIGESFQMYLNCVGHGDCTLLWGSVVVI